MVYLQESSGTALNDKLLAGQLDMAVLYERSPVAGIVSQPLLKEDLYLVGTRDCPGQSVDLTAVAEMNLFLPRDYSASTGAGHRGVHPASSVGENYRRDRIHYHPDRGYRQRHGGDGPCRNPLPAPCAARQTAGWRGLARRR